MTDEDWEKVILTFAKYWLSKGCSYEQARENAVIELWQCYLFFMRTTYGTYIESTFRVM